MADRRSATAGPAEVDAYIAALDASIRPVAEAVRDLVRSAAPETRETLKWGYPCYVGNGDICSIMPAKGYVRLQFFQGIALSDPDRLLEGTGKGMRHVKVTGAESLPRDAIRTMVREATALAPEG